MNILLDENLDWRLGRELPGHAVESVPLIGWAGMKNGALLAEAAKRFDVLPTTDSNMVHEQRLEDFPIAIIALQARGNRLAPTDVSQLRAMFASPDRSLTLTVAEGWKTMR